MQNSLIFSWNVRGLGRVGSNMGDMDTFSEFIDSFSLVDLSSHVGRFTRSNFRNNASFIRLDRFLLSPEVLRLWPDLLQSIMTKSLSDHNPICLSIMGDFWGPRPFKWFEHLLDDSSYVGRIHEECHNANGVDNDFLLKKCKLISKD
ncbi:hypothetical protein GQ457_07G009450 [Hibiscus cannabinus]